MGGLGGHGSESLVKRGKANGISSDGSGLAHSATWASAAGHSPGGGVAAMRRRWKPWTTDGRAGAATIYPSAVIMDFEDRLQYRARNDFGLGGTVEGNGDRTADSCSRRGPRTTHPGPVAQSFGERPTGRPRGSLFGYPTRRGLTCVFRPQSCIQYSIMSAHLNITIDEALYQRLKRELPPKRISAFIEEAVRAKLRPSASDLERAYKAAAKEAWRTELSAEWSSTDVEAWPE